MNKPRIIRNVAVYNGQYKITIPKEIAFKMGLQNKDAVELFYNNRILTIKKL